MPMNRKKEHKRIVNLMQKLNKELAKDEYLGCSRFRIDLYSEDWYKYSDSSGGYMSMIFKMTDKATNNKAFFMCSSYDYDFYIPAYINDFAIRCSKGVPGHLPPLGYVAYDVHSVIPYAGQRDNNNISIETETMNKYSYIKSIKID